MAWKELIFIVLIITVLSLTLFNLVKKYVLTKFKIKKKYLFVFMIVVIFLPMIFPKAYSQSILLQQGMVMLFTVAMLSYFEIGKIERIEKNKPVVGKPKSKPNRVKNNKK